LLHQTKPCNNMELDTKVSSHKDIIKKQKDIRIHSWWNIT